MFDIHSIGSAAYSIAVDGDSFRYADTNQACLELTKVSSRASPGLTPHDIFSPTIADEIVARYRTCVQTRSTLSYVAEFATPNGGGSWRTTLFPMLGPTGAVTTIIGVCAEITVDEGTHGRLSLNDHAALALGAIDGGYWVYEVAEDRFETSRSLAELVAGPGHVALNLAEYVSHVHSEDLGRYGVRDMEQDRSMAEYRVVTFDGRTLWLRSRRRILRDAEGRPVRIVGLVGDITKEKLALQTLETQATTDALTHVKNRGVFDLAAARAFTETRATGRPMGVLLMDLDGFKLVNDRFGHRAGDEILRKAARRIARHVRKSDCLARMGGDEFAILMRGTSAAVGEPLAIRLRQAFAAPFTVKDQAVFVRLSTGVAVSGDADRTAEDIVDRADHALYAMKRAQQLQTA